MKTAMAQRLLWLSLLMTVFSLTACGSGSYAELSRGPVLSEGRHASRHGTAREDIGVCRAAVKTNNVSVL